MKLVLVGNESPQKLKRLAKKYFANIKNKKIDRQKINIPAYLPTNLKKNIYIKSKEKSSALAIEFPIKNNLGVFGLSYFTDKMNLAYNNIVYEQFYDYSDINSLMNLSNLLGQYLNDRGEYILLEKPSFDMLNIEHNFGFDFYLILMLILF